MKRNKQYHELVDKIIPSIEKIGEIDGLIVFYDGYSKINEFIVGRKDSEKEFIVGGSKDIEDYKKYLRKIDKRYNRELTIEEIIKKNEI